MKMKHGKKIAKLWHEWMKPLLVIVLVAGAFRSAIADWYEVPTGSMKPTILEGDRIFVNKIAYDLKVPFTTVGVVRWDHPGHGDIIVFLSPLDGKRLVKRVVGLPGDRIEMRSHRVYINGKEAAYKPIPRNLIDGVPADQFSDYSFSWEAIAGHGHPIMIRPSGSTYDSFHPVTTPEGYYFVMGDNRDNSFDSRWFGFVARERILGRAWGVVASLNPDRHYFPRWQRFFTPLP